MPIVALALRSVLNRSATAGLVVFAIGLSVALLLGVERVRTEAKASFANTISGTDLIVGARSGGLPLLLYSVFRIGNATNNISWRSYRALAGSAEIAWTIPLSLGDSHRGYRVLGTDRGYFEHYRYGRRDRLSFAVGAPFDDVFDAVLGAAVADALGYRLDDPIVVSHGLGGAGIADHDDKPFRVAGILARTGTPVDRTVHVSLEGIEAIHVDWRHGAPVPGLSIDAEAVRKMDLTPKTITAFLVGLKSRLAVFGLQRRINEYRGEPLLAILPGVALQELWDLMGTAEAALSAISVFVVATGLLCMMAMMLASLGERRREMAILRSVGARPAHVFGLLIAEACGLTVAGIAVGLGIFYATLAAAQPLVSASYGLFLPVAPPAARELWFLAAVLVAGALSGAVPAWRAYARSIADGMTART